MFQAFVKSLGIYPIGSLVRMRSGRLGVVVEQNEHSLVAPKVQGVLLDPIEHADPARAARPQLAGCNDAIAARESNDQWKFPHLDELWAGEDILRRIGKA